MAESNSSDPIATDVVDTCSRVSLTDESMSSKGESCVDSNGIIKYNCDFMPNNNLSGDSIPSQCNSDVDCANSVSDVLSSDDVNSNCGVDSVNSEIPLQQHDVQSSNVGKLKCILVPVIHTLRKNKSVRNNTDIDQYIKPVQPVY